MKILFSSLVFLLFALVNSQAKDRPNILWITVEDMSPTIGAYGDKFARTPFLDSFSEKSVNYSNAFATAPVCSPSRSCLINGVYAQSQGTHQMRSAFKIPEFMNGFPALLRKAGYYTSNNVKTDYNSANFQKIINDSWNESSAKADWRGKKEGQPFFSVINLMTTHQSRTMVWPYEKFKQELQSKLSPEEVSNPDKLTLPPYYPDTPVIRKTVARFYDCVAVMDKEVKGILKKLKDDGLAEDTIVFFYSDHGSGMPRHKRALLDSGMKVPLMVYFPEKFKHLSPADSGTWTDRLVSFVDFGPSVLSLLDIEIPKHMQGEAFLGRQKKDARKYVYGHRDRVDEVIDMSRSVRNKKYLYIRNFMPHLSYNAPTGWPDQGEIRHEFYREAKSGSMTKAQWHFAGPTKPVEELYDCEADPLNLNNLIDSKDHSAILGELREELASHIYKINDLGFVPESTVSDINKKSSSWAYARSAEFTLNESFKSALDVGKASENTLIKNLNSENPDVRYWGAVGLTAQKSKLSHTAVEALTKRLSDESPAVRVQAATVLAERGVNKDLAFKVFKAEFKSDNFASIMHAARNVEMLGSKAESLLEDMKSLDQRMQGMRPEDVPATVVQSGDVDMAMFIGFSTKAFIDKYSKGNDWINLFDGKSLKGWEARTQGQTVKVENEEIQLLSKKANLWLVHEQEFEDFELEVEAKMPNSGYNSGIGFRCTGAKKPLGYQCEIDKKKSGSIYAIGKGWVLPSNKNAWEGFYKVAGDCFKAGEWNKFRIKCQGDHIQIWVNGHKTADIRDNRFQKGQIALQHHGTGGMHYFRKIRIKVLGK